MARQQEVDFALISEPNQAILIRTNWLRDSAGDVAILAHSSKYPVIGNGRGVGYRWAELKKLVLVSCYVSPFYTTTDYEAFLEDLTDRVSLYRKEVLIYED